MDTTVQPNATDPIPVRVARGLSVSQARNLLDWLEAHGIARANFGFDSAGRCTIFWFDEDHPASRAASPGR